MKQLSLLFFLILTIPQIIAQESTDSLAYYLGNFQYQKAIKYIDSQELSLDSQIKKALCYKSLGEYHQAIDVLLPLSEEYSENIQVKSNLAVCYEAVAQREASVRCYDDLIQLDSTNLYFKNQKADILLQQGKSRNALSLFQHIYEQNNSSTTLKRIGKCYEKMNLLDSARVCFKEAWDRNPRDAFAAANLINLSLHVNAVLEAVAYSDQYIEIDSTDHQVNLLNALSYYRMDDYEEAAKRFTKCYLNGDSSLVVVRSLGISHFSLNESSKAIPYLEMAYRQDTANNNVLYCLAISYKDKSEYELAIPLLHKLLDRTIPGNLTLFLYYRNLAESYSSWSDPKNAVVYYEEALNYADDNQRMNVYYSLAGLNEYRIWDRKKALYYYNMYRESLIGYIDRLKGKDSDESKEIARSSKILTDLETYIKQLEISRER